ncbi:MAG: hypothetical protein LKG13_05695, partial [Atopobiaceae bacterium]|nr:hypothetical protein [Atopobiaceae bacterium]
MRRIVSDLTSCATPGAYVSLACEVEGPYEKDRLDHALAASAAAHPLLRARVTVGDDGLPAFEVGHDPYVTVGEVAPIPLADLACTDAGAWDPLAGPLLRVTTCSSEDGFLLLLQAHDLLSDGPGLLSLMEGMVDAYVTGRGPEPGEDGGIMGASDLPDEAAPAWMAARTLAHANREWEAADGRLDLSDLSGYLEQATARHPVAHACQLLDVDGTSQLGERAEAAHARITSFVAAAASVAFEARKVDVGVDVRGDVASYVPGALGSFSSVVRVDATAGAGDLDARAW